MKSERSALQVLPCGGAGVDCCALIQISSKPLGVGYFNDAWSLEDKLLLSAYSGPCCLDEIDGAVELKLLARPREPRLDQGPVVLRLPAAEVSELERRESALELPTSLVD